MRKEHFQPIISDRRQRSLWIAQGADTAEKLAHDIVVDILKEKPKKYIDLKNGYEPKGGVGS
jgi:trimethylamine:corrinoid methyltransferase-like protein